MIAPDVLIGFIRYRQKNGIELRAIAPMALFAMLSTYLAAHYAARLDPRVLQIGFALFLIGLALYFGWHTKYGMSQTRALALVVPGALIALLTYAGTGHVSWSTGIPLASGGVVSVSWGVTLVTH